MADISSMTLPNGSTYNVKDTDARLGKGFQEMTLAQYNNLTSEQKNDGSVRFITDGGSADGGSDVFYSSVTLSSENWTGNTAPYTYEMTISGILATDRPLIDVVMSGTYSTDIVRNEEWPNIYRAVPFTNSIIFYAKKKPEVDLPIQIICMRYGGSDAIYSIILSSENWSGNTAPYSYELSVNGVLLSDKPVIDVVMSGTYSTDIARNEAWQHIYRAATAANTIVFYADEQPSVDLPVQIMCVR